MQNIKHEGLKIMNRTGKGWMLFLALALALGAGLNTARVTADSGAATYAYLIGTGVVCDFGPLACPAVALTAAGDRLELSGAGTLSIHPNSVSGSGDATHYFAGGGSVTGTWSAKKLLSFTEYGCGRRGSPHNYCGGQAVIRIGIFIDGVNVIDGNLKVTSRRGKFPAGTVEGITFAAGGNNFNQTISGSTLFIRQP